MDLPPKEVYDVSGAGDTVVGVIGLALGSGASYKEAAVLANFAAGIVVGKIGTATLSMDELKEAVKKGLN
jgi:D-beta-D-heptose 7-phosphate kinase/D-beta-D-heptose 1-phosphate adenosyltransferase